MLLMMSGEAGGQFFTSSLWTWFDMHVPPRFHRLLLNLQMAVAFTVFVTWHVCPSLFGILGLQVTFLSPWHTTIFAISPASSGGHHSGRFETDTLRIWLQPLLQTVTPVKLAGVSLDAQRREVIRVPDAHPFEIVSVDNVMLVMWAATG